MKLTIHRSMLEVDAEAWNALTGTANPFLRHEFLTALETTGCVSPQAGWIPLPVTLHDDLGRLIAAAPAYLKLHSWGEFVFDWAWADAHARQGLEYYPKLIVAAPFTPATGSRLLTASGHTTAALLPAVADTLRDFSREQQWSSVHWLFLPEAQASELAAAGHSIRHGFQFHWQNAGYTDFDDFLAALSSKKRKNIRRERREVQAQGFSFRRRYGGEVDRAGWQRFSEFYRATFAAYGNVAPLTAEFFAAVGASLPEQVLLVEAVRHGSVEAAALCFIGDGCLYGRYWGSLGEYSSLHFETCYYQGIEHCIKTGLQRFEPGAQGAHKVARGFLPTLTYSAHAINDARLSAAIEAFVQRERAMVAAAMEEHRQHSPYRMSAD